MDFFLAVGAGVSLPPWLCALFGALKRGFQSLATLKFVVNVVTIRYDSRV